MEWTEAIQEEVDSLQEQDTWPKTSLPPGAKALPTKFVFKRKCDVHGTVVRHKARLVVQGFLQGLVHDTYAPVQTSPQSAFFFQLLFKRYI